MSEVLELAEEVAGLTDDLWLVFTKADKKKVLISGAMILAGTALMAGTAAWQIAKKRTEIKYEDILEQEIEQAREYFARRSKQEEFSTPQSAVQAIRPESAPDVEEAADALISYQSFSQREDEEDEGTSEETQVQVRNVFTEQANYWDQEKEEANRSEDAPYIISYEEWMNGDYQQTQLTYFEGDEVLVDAKDQPIPLVDDAIGEGNLRFGYGSGDPDTVLIRNDKMSLDFEVARSTGRYDREILGLQHSDEVDRERDRRPVRRMRDDCE